MRAACDVVVPHDRFMAEALGLPAEVPAEAATEPPVPRLRCWAPWSGPSRRRHACARIWAACAATGWRAPCAGQSPELIELATRLHAAIGLPALSPTQYRAAFAAMAAAISETGVFDLIGRTVDRCRAAGVEIVNRPVSDMREMLRGAGFDFASGKVSGADVTAAFHAGVLALCRQEEVALSATEQALLDEWLGLSGPGPDGDEPGIGTAGRAAQ